MIGSLRGKLLFKQAPAVTVECAGVGYELETPMSTFMQLPATGKDVFLHTHLVVREDAHTLFGFANADEKAVFRTLLKITGVGAKMALALLSTLSIDELRAAVQCQETATLVRVPGIGKKTAERLLIELRDKFEGLPEAEPAAEGGSVDARREAQDALLALGYKTPEVQKMLRDADSTLSAEELIRRALRGSAKGTVE